ncbi:unnamed protein product [Hymenolepis diminuta]|uniref:Uncharacterized protein n=1 Tax=Hymenolepis diminuta TaxID=6216 RepID=A0A564XZE8_HYMDI|nr:unnamed protein product [Hymenolepis diminuta]
MFYVPMKQSQSAMSKRAHRFPPFYNNLVPPKKYICAHVLARLYSSDSHKAIIVFHSNNARVSVTGFYASYSSPLFLSTLPSLSLSVTGFRLVVASLNIFYSNQLLVFGTKIVVIC